MIVALLLLNVKGRLRGVAFTRKSCHFHNSALAMDYCDT